MAFKRFTIICVCLTFFKNISLLFGCPSHVPFPSITSCFSFTHAVAIALFASDGLSGETTCCWTFSDCHAQPCNTRRNGFCERSPARGFEGMRVSRYFSLGVSAHRSDVALSADHLLAWFRRFGFQTFAITGETHPSGSGKGTAHAFCLVPSVISRWSAKVRLNLTFVLP